MLDVRSFKGVDCVSDHYLVTAKVRERVSVSQQTAQKLDVKRFILKLSELGVTKLYQIKISESFAAFGNFNS